MTKMTDYQHYVYAHTDPRDGSLVYIGHGRAGRAWVCGSEGTTHRSKDHTAWQDELMSSGFTPEDWVLIIQSGLPKKDAASFEQFLIDQYKPIFNQKVGQGALKMTAELFAAAKAFREEGLSYAEIAKEVGLTAMTIYRALNSQTKAVKDFE